MEGVDLPPGYTTTPGVAGQGNDAQQSEEVEEQRSMILDQIMTPEARERLNHIKLVKKERARNIEDMLIHSARMGRLGTQRVTEDQFLQMLESVKMQYERKTKVTIQRRKCFGEEEDDDPDGDLL